MFIEGNPAPTFKFNKVSSSVSTKSHFAIPVKAGIEMTLPRNSWELIFA
jgi:hypothetical protein